jgi:hypothetical protein
MHGSYLAISANVRNGSNADISDRRLLSCFLRMKRAATKVASYGLSVSNDNDFSKPSSWKKRLRRQNRKKQAKQGREQFATDCFHHQFCDAALRPLVPASRRAAEAGKRRFDQG